MRLRGKVTVITGGGGGIGSSIVKRYAGEGASVVVGDIDSENARRVAADLGSQAVHVPVDVTDARQVEKLVSTAVRAFGRIDVLVNVAGVGLTKSFLKTTLEEWRRVLDINLTGTFLCSQAAALIMANQNAGKIINITSLSAQRAGTGRAAYGASKAGVTMLTKVMAVELAPYGIAVNEIAPGPVNTPMTAITHDEATRQAYYNLIPMRRYAEQDEIADAAVFLASDEARFVNGHTLNVDGGFQAAGLMFKLKEE